MKKPLVILFIIIVLIIDIYCLTARSEVIEGWIMCQPDSCVNIREKPKKKSTAFGEMELCDKIYTDGKVVNGYLHCVDVPAESNEGWVASAYVVFNEPYKPRFVQRSIITTTRVAARKTINGKVRTWLHNGDVVNVYAISDEWCVTSEGFVKTEFIDTGSYYNEKFYDASAEMTYEPD